MPDSNRGLLPVPRSPRIPPSTVTVPAPSAPGGPPRLPAPDCQNDFCPCACRKGSRDFGFAKRMCEARPLPSAPESPLSFLVEGGGERGDLQPATIHQGAGNLCPQQVPEGSAEGALSRPPVCVTASTAREGGLRRHVDQAALPSWVLSGSATGRAAPPADYGLRGKRLLGLHGNADPARPARAPARCQPPGTGLCKRRSASLWRGEEAEGREERAPASHTGGTGGHA